MAFAGFGAETLGFLERLSANNNRDWFGEHKAEYEALVLEPALDFITAMGPVIEKISGQIEAVPKRQGGSLMRVYRDTRFSKDKTPYKTNIGIQFRHAAGKDVHAPGYYMHMATDEVFLGVGMWHPDSPSLAGIRQAIDESPDTWRKASRGRAFTKRFELQGDSLKRPPKGYAADHPMLEDLKRKDFIAVTSMTRAEVADPKLPKALGKILKPTEAYMAFLCAAVGQPF